MIREVDLASYLPLFMQKYREPVEALKAEDPEFLAVWEAADRILYNHFICTADEYGISRFEKMLGILHSGGETLEERRKRIQGYYVGDLPYTENKMRAVLAVVCGAGNFELDVDGAAYQMTVRVIDRDIQLVRNVHKIISFMKPANILLKLYEMYREEVQQTVRSQVAAVRFGTAFYPMFNLPELCLDGSWELDGSQSLDGYNGGDKVDLNPVSMAVHVPVHVDTAAGCRVRIPCRAEVTLEAGAAVRISGKVEHDTRVQAGTRLSFPAAHRISTGAVMHMENDLDGGWVLDGSRSLDGGDYPL